ncbi:hypothetical protein THF1C08_80253 [Vibrio jasicida]|uniref:Uncharacterized protein n=1 Tax=Vibrio jasicida TaxID=766224 RepID=A0AAU9QWP1_9VIBR|nr:hypothetical protein THF1C08_80253 [Vibrio jasicida]CAH1603532.1 hypothetical protein THF1A12_70251 [Vibrio jasicida]
MTSTTLQIDENLFVLLLDFSLNLLYFLKSSLFYALRLKLSPYKIRLVR